jgi:hypothetical protein
LVDLASRTIAACIAPGICRPAGGADGLDGGLHVEGRDPPELVVTVTDRPTEVAGRLQDSSGRPAPEYFILAFPADPARRRPGSYRIRATRPATDGEFSIRGLPPGDYLIAALTDLDTNEWNDPALLEQAARAAVPVSLAEGERARQDLQIR